MNMELCFIVQEQEKDRPAKGLSVTMRENLFDDQL